MHITSIKLTNFKNYPSQEVDFSLKLNCLVGLNGMGKTNMLEAIYYLCMCKSPRNLNDRRIVMQGQPFFRLEGAFQKDEDTVKVVAKVAPGKQKAFEYRGKEYEWLSDHIGRFPIVMITPDDVSVIHEGSEERRRFLDNTLSQIYPDYLEQLIKYNRLLKQRNASLKQMGEANSFSYPLLEVYDKQLEEPATTIFQYRKKFMERFDPIFQQYYQSISADQEKVSGLYHSKLGENPVAELWKESLEKDRVLQRTTVGIHRDDIKLLLNGEEAKRYASQGQLKSIVLALKLAQYALIEQDKGLSPILLLDDLFDRLDSKRVQQLLELLLQPPFGQIFISDTQQERLEKILEGYSLAYKMMRVEKGEIFL